MINLLVMLFVIKLYARNIFTCIKKKHGQDVRKLIRSYESLITKHMKVTAVAVTASNKYFDKDFLNIKLKY